MFVFVDLIRSGTRPLSFYQDRIRNVCVACRSSHEQVVTILSACRTLHTLALMNLHLRPSAADATAFHSSLTKFRPTRLFVWLDRLDIHSAPGVDWLQRLTHLQLCITNRYADLDDYLAQFNDNVLQHLPELTHLSYIRLMSGSMASSFASSLHLSTRFVVCIIWVYNSPCSSWINAHDPRIVLGFNSPGMNGTWTTDRMEIPEYVVVLDPLDNSLFYNDWGQKPTVNGPGMWELAEEKARMQRKLQEASQTSP
ncbi:hypothetical protein C8J56DRAFT_914614 [Mycena floridula]|nr:hypothetical protein C8J56DRAFT_914614 [Mycena floridula]